MYVLSIENVSVCVVIPLSGTEKDISATSTVDRDRGDPITDQEYKKETSYIRFGVKRRVTSGQRQNEDLRLEITSQGRFGVHF